MYKRYIDLRSDTVTQPTEAMRRAMASAEVGDDVYRDDPTTNELERLAAERLGKEAALFVTSGTMGNQLGIFSQTSRGDEIIVGSNAHIVVHEVGAPAVLSSVSTRQLDYPGCMPDPEMIEAAIRSDDIHEPPTSLICMENALANGRVVPIETMERVWEVAQTHGLRVHLDGARLFNAALALNVDVRELTRCCSTVSCCLSKGLCAPVGAVLAGDRAAIERARKGRKLLGGGMRQNGILAAAGILALTEMPQYLVQDHENAAYLAQQLAQIEGLSVRWEQRDINMVFFTLDRPAAVLDAVPARLMERGVKVGAFDRGEARWVTNHDVSRADLDAAVAALKEII